MPAIHQTLCSSNSKIGRMSYANTSATKLGPITCAPRASVCISMAASIMLKLNWYPVHISEAIICFSRSYIPVFTENPSLCIVTITWGQKGTRVVWLTSP